jgi:MFS family permease
MFLVEGLPSVVLGVISYFFITDTPAQAKWLSPREKALLAAEISGPAPKHSSFRQVLTDGRVYLLAFVWFTVACGLYLISFWLPTMISRAGIKGVMHIGLYSAIPWVAAAIGMIVFGRSSDRHRERRWHFSLLAFSGALTLGIATIATTHFVLFFVCIILATGFLFSAFTVYWAMPPEYIKGDAAAGAIALINSIGLVGGFISPSIIGWSKTVFGSLNPGLFVIVGLLFLGSMLIAFKPPIQLPRVTGPGLPAEAFPGHDPIEETV